MTRAAGSETFVDIPMPGPWVERGGCRRCPTAMFFPVKDERQWTVPPRQVCAACPVIDDCLSYALDHPQLQGIWGGTTEGQRRAIRSPRFKRRSGPKLTRP